MSNNHIFSTWGEGVCLRRKHFWVVSGGKEAVQFVSSCSQNFFYSQISEVFCQVVRGGSISTNLAGSCGYGTAHISGSSRPEG